MRAMGLGDLFKRQSPIEKLGKDLREPYAQPEVRRGAMNKLIEMGTPEAYDALLSRFTFNASGHIADEEEKRDLTDELVRIGKPMVEPIRKFVKKEKAISFPLRAVIKILERKEALAFMMEMLSGMEPLDHRTTQQKTHLIVALSELQGAEHAQKLVPYLDDHHDDVQFQAVEALEKLKDPATYDALAAVCTGDKHSARIMRRAAHALEVLEVDVKGRYDQFNAELKSEYQVTKKGTLAKKTAPAK